MLQKYTNHTFSITKDNFMFEFIGIVAVCWLAYKLLKFLARTRHSQKVINGAVSFGVPHDQAVRLWYQEAERIVMLSLEVASSDSVLKNSSDAGRAAWAIKLIYDEDSNPPVHDNGEQGFLLDLDSFLDEFGYIMNAIDSESYGEMKSRAINNYKERTSQEAGYSASDFYLDAFTGAIFELTRDSIISAVGSLEALDMFGDFLQRHPQYCTTLTGSLLHSWRSILTSRGVMPNY
ncbi:MAG: hypothetical protein ACJAS1_006328 [Oleiphilaceae bacterium]|jgi:hypothetical protein